MAARDDLVQYLRARRLDRVLRALRERYRRLGRVAGTVAVTPEEAEALRGLLGKPPRSGRLRLQEMDEALQRSGFRCSLPAALAAYFGEPVVTRAQEAAQEEEAWQAQMARWQELAQGAASTTRWLAGDAPHLRREWRPRPQELAAAVELVIRALAQLPGDPQAPAPGGAPPGAAAGEPQPVFAHRVAGDPHALDPDRLAGRLWLRALAHRYPEAVDPEASLAEQRSALLAAAGLVVDDVSSTVLVAGLLGPDSLLAAARANGVPLALPLRTLERLAGVQAWRGRAYVVENPPVFSGLLDALAAYPPERRPTLICTSGQLSLAGRRLLDRLAAAGAEIWYSGDFDPAGLRIVRGLMARYGEQLRLWRMGAADYQAARAAGGQERRQRAVEPGGAPAVGEQPAPGAGGGMGAGGNERWAGLSGLVGLETAFPQLVPALAEGGSAYQEALLPQLAQDLRRFADAQG